MPRFTRRYLLNLLLALLLSALLILEGALPAWDAFQALHPRRYLVGENTPARLGLAYEEVSFTAADRLTLHGWFIPAQPPAETQRAPAVIAVHAYNGNRSGVLYHAQLLAQHGYAVLAFDLRAHGESDGKLFAFGWDADQDVLAALAYLQNRPEVDAQRIGVLGLSIGAEAALLSAAQPAGSELRAVIAEGAGWETLEDWRLDPTNYTPALLPGMWVFYTTGGLVSRVRPRPLSQAIAQTTTPLLLISAGKENGLAKIYFERANGPKQHWARPEAGHIDALFKHPQEYQQRVLEFLARHLQEK